MGLMNYRKALFLTLPLAIGSGLCLTSCVAPSQGGQSSDGVYADPNNPYAVPGVSTQGGYAQAEQAAAYTPADDNVSYQPIPATNVNIPVTTPNSSPAPVVSPRRTSPSSTRASGGSHVVSSGDTLFGLSRKYGVSVDSIKQANGLSSDIIRTGQSLSIPR